MPSDDWYCRTTWTAKDRDEFNACLKRARKYNRPQYLRIQAVHLADVGNYPAALKLLDRFLEIDDGSIHLAQAQLQRAEALLAVGSEQSAIDAFRASLDAERKRPNVQTEAWLLFSWFIVESERTQLYREAADVLNEFSKQRSSSFPVSDYRYHCAQAILLAHAGELEQAKAHALKALQASDAKHSGFRYHANLGLVQDTNTTVHKLVSKIAEQPDEREPE